MLPTIFYDLPTTASRRNKFIVPSSDSELQVFNILDVFGDEAQLLSQQFVYPRKSLNTSSADAQRTRRQARL